MSSFEVVVGDCREVMRAMDAESVDAIVTDPPYELGFMGKRWDGSGIAYDAAVWSEALRILKPGAHLLAFGGTRTYHRLTCAIEDAGFEIRDCIAWMYGSGFPKSLDVSKALDKRRADDVRPVCRFLRAAMDRAGLNSRQVAERFGFHSRMVDHWAARDTDSQPSAPTCEQWLALKELLGFGDDMDAEVWRLNGRKGQPGEAWSEREITGTVEEWRDRSNFALTSADGLRRDNPATELAARWSGFGTALKPAFEPIVVARKPLIGTVAANVSAYGCGALNIDGCRVGTSKEVPASLSRARGVALSGSADGSLRREDGSGSGHDPNVGRWPANVILDEEAGEMLDAQTGERRSSAGTRGERGSRPGGFGNVGSDRGSDRPNGPQYGDRGGASRFFYCAKASRAERNAGLDDMPEVPASVGNLEAAGRDPSNPANYRQDSVKRRVERGEPATLPRANHHPTVKPLSLMQWLVRLVTPPGGLVFDLFNGSGGTGCAAVLEGFDYYGCDLDPEYVEIARRRIAHHASLAAKSRDEPSQADMFGEAA